MQVIVDGLLTSYEMSGKGPVVVVLHGWGDTAAGLQWISQPLQQHFTVIVPDLPGFGGSQAPSTAWDLTHYAHFIEELLVKLNIEQIFAFIAHSNGGAIVIRGLGNGALTADRLVLLASAGIRGTYKGRVKALRYATKFGKVLTTPLPKRLKRSLRQKVYQTVGSDMLVAEHMQETFKKVVTDDVQPDAQQIKLPTLLIYGDHDTQTPPAYGKTLHGLINGSRLEIVPGADHFLNQQHASEVVQSIQDFLQ